MKNKLDVEQLQDYSIFENFDQKDITKFSEKITLLTFNKNDTIIKEGDEGNSILFLIDGDISISQALTLKTNKYEYADNREKELIRIKSSEQKFTFGEISLFNSDKKRTATVKANSKCLIGKLNFLDLFQICDSNNNVGYKLMRNICSIITKQLISSNNNVLKLTTAFSLMVDN